MYTSSMGKKETFYEVFEYFLALFCTRYVELNVIGILHLIGNLRVETGHIWLRIYEGFIYT